MNMFSVENKRVLITGSSQGLGFGFAEGLGLAGAEIILNGRNAEKLKAAQQKLIDKKIKTHICAFDVTDETQVLAGIDKIETEIGPIDILINNAGMIARGPFEDFDSNTWWNVVTLNLKSPFLVSKAVGKKMIARKKGKIINITSLLSEGARPSISPYTASKGGLKMLTKAMAVEFAKHNIQVNAIGPGYFATELNSTLKANKDFDNWVCTRTPAGRWGDPSELVGAAIFLSSSASDFITGQTIYVDGGWLAAL
jgi:gluconate 5-dehydrogenase